MTRTILLADDSVTIQKVVELTFLDEDVRVVAVGNGADAIARLDEVRPDAVIADVHMPGADGYEVCAAARARLPGTPVLLLVGTFEVFDAARAAEAGAEGHLKKPFDSQELLRRTREMLEAAPARGSVAAAPAAEPPAGEAADAGSELLPAIDAAASSEEAESPSWSFEPIEETASGAEAAPATGTEPPVAEEVWGGPVFEPAPPEEPVAEEIRLAPEAAPVVGVASSPAPAGLSEEDVDRIARRVIELGGERIVRDIAWEVVPDLAEVLLKARIRELEASVE